MALGANESLIEPIIKIYSFLDKNIAPNFFELNENRERYLELHRKANESIINIRKEFMIKNLKQH